MAHRNVHPPLTWRYLILSLFVGLFACIILFLSLRSSDSLTKQPSDLYATRPLAKLLGGKIIPGNPLYLFYMARDRIRFITEHRPQERYLLLVEYARSRLLAAQELIRYDEVSLGITTLAKAEVYLGLAVETLLKYHPEQTIDQHQINQLFTALTIHEQYMREIHDALSDTQKTELDKLISYNLALQQTLYGFVRASF
ncbi:MAG: hypothetical protein HZA34_02730 [Candidatus Pacebacteria bacterium]|nr:hypothetical protein [Candidatus Paceibacterota bacterium]